MRIILIFLLLFAASAYSVRQVPSCKRIRWEVLEGGRFTEPNLFVTKEEFFEIWKNARAGDSDAVKAYVMNVTSLTNRLLYRRLRQDHDVDDALQETLIAGITKVEATSPEQLIALLMGVARRKSVDLIRKRCRQRARFPFFIDFEEPPPEEGEFDKSLIEILNEGKGDPKILTAMHAYIKPLLQNQAQVLKVYEAIFENGMTALEASALLGLKIDTVHGYVTRIRYRLEEHEEQLWNLAN